MGILQQTKPGGQKNRSYTNFALRLLYTGQHWGGKEELLKSVLPIS